MHAEGRSHRGDPSLAPPGRRRAQGGPTLAPGRPSCGASGGGRREGGACGGPRAPVRREAGAGPDVALVDLRPFGSRGGARLARRGRVARRAGGNRALVPAARLDPTTPIPPRAPVGVRPCAAKITSRHHARAARRPGVFAGRITSEGLAPYATSEPTLLTPIALVARLPRHPGGSLVNKQPSAGASWRHRRRAGTVEACERRDACPAQTGPFGLR